jgi:hypothetical protein
MVGNIKMNLKDTGWDGVDGTYWFHKMCRISWLSKDLLASQMKSDPLI